MATDPVCRMEVNEKMAKCKSQYGGETYYFCSLDCKQEFDEDPEEYVI